MIPIFEKLRKRIQTMFDWFSENLLKAIADKCYLSSVFCSYPAGFFTIYPFLTVKIR